MNKRLPQRLSPCRQKRLRRSGFGTSSNAIRGVRPWKRSGACRWRSSGGVLRPARSQRAGKTTTIEILEGLLTPTSGSVEVLGLRWDRDEGRLRELIGVSLQETRLSEKLTLLETVRLFRSFYSSGIEPLAALELVGLVHKAAARVSDVSGGERQRLAVATAVVGWPRLLFLDEPTTGLDPQSRRQIWSLVEMFRGCGHTVMLTTHFMDEAERLCDRLAIVDAGRIIAEGTPAELLAEFGVAHLDDVFVKLAGRRLSESGWAEPILPGDGGGAAFDAEAGR